MKKISFIIISAVIIVFITGNYFIYREFTKSHKKEFKAFIRSRYVKTEIIEICPSELYANNSKISWMDENKEVLVDGEIFDVVSICNAGKKVLLSVVRDRYEKELMTQYQNQFDDFYKSKPAKSNHSYAKDFFALKYLCLTNQTIEMFATETDFASFNQAALLNGYLSQATPPPDSL